MTGICITVYNRPDYLQRCLDSLAKADLTDCEVVIVDDCSEDERVGKMLYDTYFNVIYLQKRLKVYGALLEGFRILQNCDTLMVLDSDAIVKPDFVSKCLTLLNKFPDEVITGFNCVTKDKNGRERHKIIETGEGWNKKDSIGGIHMVFSRETYQNKVKPELEACVRKGGQWDINLCKKMGGAYSVVPSVIQHIGFYSSMGHMHDHPDVADDFGDIEQVKSKSDCDVLVVNQFQGIGDVIFCMELVRKLANGARILWAVYGPYVEGLNKAYPDVTFVDYQILKINYESREDIQKNGIRIIPLRFADQILRLPFKDCMKAKYDMYGMDWQTWTNSRPIFTEKGKELADKLGATGDYCLVNTKFRTAQTGNIVIPKTNLPVIEMKNIDGYSIFDWWYIIQHAKEIHTVSTSIIYIMELLPSLSCIPNIYIRVPDEKSHENYDYIMKKHEYNFIENKIPETGNVRVQVLQNYHDIQLKSNMRRGQEFVCSVERANVLISRGRVTIIGIEPTEQPKGQVTHIPKQRY